MITKTLATIKNFCRLVDYNLTNIFQDPEGMLLNVMRNQFICDRIKVEVQGINEVEEFYLYVFSDEPDVRLTDEEKNELLFKTFKEELGIELTFK